MKKIKYITNIIVEFFLLFLVPCIILILEKVELISLSLGKLTLGDISIDISKIVTYVLPILLFTGVLIFIQRLNKDKEFLSGEAYGDYPWFIYIIAYWLGYRKIRLSRKPYYIIYLLLKKKKFMIIDETDEICNLEFELLEDEKDGQEYVNLIIADTYQINMDQIPISVKKYKTIFVKRKESNGVRFYNKPLCEKVGIMLTKLRNDGKIINLFMTTSISNTREIFEEYLIITSRERFRFNLYQQDSTGIRKFKEKPYNGGELYGFK